MTLSASSGQGRSLPANPSLHQLRTQAKDILKAHHAGDASCCEVLRKLSRLANASDDDILAAQLQLKDAQFALAMHYGFESWAALKAHVEAVSGERVMSATVFGRVTAEDGGQAIEDAEVRIELRDERHDPVAYACVRTDSDGRYQCDLEWTGAKGPTLRYQAKHVAYAAQWWTKMESDEMPSRLLRMQDGQQYELSMTLPDGFTLELTAVDEDGLPVEGAEVTLHVEDETGRGVPYPPTTDMVTGQPGKLIFPTTDAQGRCRIEGIRATQSSVYTNGAYIKHPRYSREILRDIGALPRDGAVARATVHLQRGLSLTGQAVCADSGAPIEGVTVRSYREEAGGEAPSEGEAITGPDGRFEIHGLAGRPHEVRAWRSGWATSEISSLEVPQPGPLLIRMHRGRVIRGRVFDRTGKPAGGAKIRLGGRGSRSTWPDAVTDEDGRFEIGGLSTDEPVWLAAKHESPYAYEAYGFVRVNPDDEPYVVFDGREMVELDGCVLDESGEPVPVRVSCTVWGETDVDQTVHIAASPPLDANGAFRALVPPNGDVIVELLSEENCFTSPFFNAEHITMRDGRPNRSLTVTANPSNKLRLRFLDDQSGQPVPGVIVSLQTAADQWSLGWTESSDQDGVLVFEHLPASDVEFWSVTPGYEPVREMRLAMPTDEEVVVRLTPKAGASST